MTNKLGLFYRDTLADNYGCTQHFEPGIPQWIEVYLDSWTRFTFDPENVL